MAGADDGEAAPRSLRAAWDEAEARRRAIEAGDNDRGGGGSAATASIEAALALYGRVVEGAAAAGLWSANEGVDDVATAALPLLLAPFCVAELVLRLPAPEAAPRPSSSQHQLQLQLHQRRRLAALRRARAEYARFLDGVDALGLVGAPYAALLERFRDDADAFAVAPPAADAAARRGAKVAAFRAQRALDARLDLLRARRRSRHRRRSGAADEVDDDDDADDEVVRDLHLARVDRAVHAAFDALDSLNRECALLAQAPPEPSPPPPTPLDDAADDDPTLRLDRPLARGPARADGPLLSRAGRPLRPFTLVGSRADRARAVFRPGHNLPTMSVDEYLAEERRRGNVLDGGTDPAPPPVDDNMDAADRDTYKARQWDDFKDDNPRGSGNTLNMG